MPYSSAANKTMAAFKKTYGSGWKKPYYALANKRTGGAKGKGRGAKAANRAYAKGTSWKGGVHRRGVGRARGGLRVR